MTMKRFAPALLAVSLALLGGGCAASRSQVARDFTVMNETDVFELHYGTLENFSNRQTFSWTNTGSRARVRQASSVQSGVALVEIRDPSGLVVHSKNLREQGSFVSFEGKPGVWKITVILDRAAGSLTFEVRKNP